MQFEHRESLRRHHAAWRLLRADNAPLVLSFLGTVFVDENVRTIPAGDLESRLDDELYALNQRLGDGTFPKSPAAYLNDWSAPESGWLRKYYPPDSDEVHFDATPAVEKALAWVKALEERAFVGTESRLNTVFELLRQMAFGAETDPQVRLVELRRRRDALDAEILAVTADRFSLLDPVALRDRYQQFTSTARELLADFREVEANFRQLDRELRARIATWAGSKGELLDEMLGSRDSIAESDQGRSFRAFYDFLLSYERQSEFTELLERVQELEAIGDPDPRMRRIHHDWLDAGSRTQSMVRLLSEQLRRFLGDQVWLENRRVMDILRSIEASTVRVRSIGEPDVSVELDATAPEVVLPLERPLYRVVERAPLVTTDIVEAAEEVDADLLFQQVFVDPERLAEGVRAVLRRRAQIGLATLLADRPLEQGLAELVTYLSLNDPEFEVVFDEEQRDHVCWCDSDGVSRAADVPRITFVRKDFERGAR
ncbi:DUF3375 domain-containing protein [Nocardia crassostreae]|uniref:DUF3375 domain-containing protein n=1 Tax=Nocardia crassostreae TaxID=53428 RepID=UPI00082CA79F|nr:DUF3375 domain-containing protein [Nocardia crassostreae]